MGVVWVLWGGLRGLVRAVLATSRLHILAHLVSRRLPSESWTPREQSRAGQHALLELVRCTHQASPNDLPPALSATRCELVQASSRRIISHAHAAQQVLGTSIQLSLTNQHCRQCIDPLRGLGVRNSLPPGYVRWRGRRDAGHDAGSWLGRAWGFPWTMESQPEHTPLSAMMS